MATVLALERHPVRSASVAEFESLVEDLVAEMRRQPGVLWADTARAADDEPSFLVLSEWRTEADLDAWEGSPSATAFCERVDVLVRESPTRRRFSAGA